MHLARKEDVGTWKKYPQGSMYFKTNTTVGYFSTLYLTQNFEFTFFSQSTTTFPSFSGYTPGPQTRATTRQLSSPKFWKTCL